jgi:hypothetical protein
VAASATRAVTPCSKARNLAGGRPGRAEGGQRRQKSGRREKPKKSSGERTRGKMGITGETK